MATTYKVLGQINPIATSASSIYTVPSATQTVISSLTICNYGSTQAQYRIAVRPDGEALSFKHYVSYDSVVPANDTIALTLGLTMNSLDIVTVYASSASVTFNAYGSEII